MRHMAGVVVGIIRAVDEARGVLVIGGTEFWVPQSIPLAGLAPGISITLTYEVIDGKHVATALRANPR
jgi:hypothetical protein